MINNNNKRREEDFTTLYESKNDRGAGYLK